MTAPVLVERLRAYLQSRPDVRQIVTNAGWLVSDRVIRLVLVLLVSAWVTRYLGAEQYGYLSIAQAILALAIPLLRLGMDTLIVRLLVEGDYAREAVLGTGFVIRLIAALVALPTVVIFTALAYPHNLVIALIAAMLGVAALAESFDVIDFWNQSQVAARRTVIARNVAFIVTSGLKVGAILLEQPLEVFGLLYALDTALYVALLVGVYQRSGGRVASWRWDASLAKTLLTLSAPLIVSGIAVSLYMRIDQLMLSLLLPAGEGERAVGIYSVAVRLSEAWYFVPLAIISSVFPAILQSKRQDEILYRKRVQRLFNLVTLVGYGFAVPVTLLAPTIVNALFGPEFAEAAPQLAVLAWAGVWIGLGSARTPVLQAERMLEIIMFGTVCGTIVNILLNAALIPRYEGMGCAVATLISYGVSACLSSFFSAKTAPFGWMQLKAIVSPNPMMRVNG
ncbi:flippase [Aggregatilineales bacterium SYSU G02658]